jgi:hypothetical protein
VLRNIVKRNIIIENLQFPTADSVIAIISRSGEIEELYRTNKGSKINLKISEINFLNPDQIIFLKTY